MNHDPETQKNLDILPFRRPLGGRADRRGGSIARPAPVLSLFPDPGRHEPGKRAILARSGWTSVDGLRVALGEDCFMENYSDLDAPSPAPGSPAA